MLGGLAKNPSNLQGFLSKIINENE